MTVINLINNCFILQSRGGRFWINEDTQFKDLAELIHHHSLNSSGLVTTLTHPVPNVSCISFFYRNFIACLISTTYVNSAGNYQIDSFLSIEKPISLLRHGADYSLNTSVISCEIVNLCTHCKNAAHITLTCVICWLMSVCSLQLYCNSRKLSALFVVYHSALIINNRLVITMIVLL